MSINGKNLRLELHRTAYTNEVIIDMANDRCCIQFYCKECRCVFQED